MAPTLYVNVPDRIVCEMIDKHGGMTDRSGRLPHMSEVDEDGSLWAEPAAPPSTTDTEEEEREEEGGGITYISGARRSATTKPTTNTRYTQGRRPDTTAITAGHGTIPD